MLALRYDEAQGDERCGDGYVFVSNQISKGVSHSDGSPYASLFSLIRVIIEVSIGILIFLPLEKKSLPSR